MGEGLRAIPSPSHRVAMGPFLSRTAGEGLSQGDVMPIEIRMPALSPTMTEGNLARWLKKEGDEVHSGDVIAEIETDKATMEYEAADEGRLGRIIVPEGAQGIKVNQPIAQVLELAGSPPYSEKPHSAMRRVIARRLSESKQTIPHFYMSIDCVIDELLKIRTVLNARSEAQRISVNDFVIRAAALALRQVPAANASWSDDAILLWQRADIAVPVWPV